MKTILKSLVALAFAATIACAQPASMPEPQSTPAPAAAKISLNSLVDQIVALSVDQILPESMILAAINEVEADLTRYESQNIDWDSAYHSVRQTVYENKAIPGNSSDEGNLVEDEPFSIYRVMRTMVVARLKEYLHTKDNLQAFYTKHRPAIKARLAIMKPQSRAVFRAKLASAVMIFKVMRDQPTVVAAFKANPKDTANGWEDLILLGENTTAAKAAERIKAGELNAPSSNPSQAYADPKLARFAARRAIEGGAALVDKYLNVLTMLQNDLGQ